MQVPLPSTFDQSIAPSTTQVQSLGDSVFDRNDISNSIKNAVLRYRIQQAINANAEAGVSVTGVDIYDFQAHKTIVQENQDAVQFAASINKLPVAWLALQDLRAHKFNLTDTVTWQASDVRGGYGTYDQPGAPTSATVQDVLYDMLNHSGNTAVRVIVNYKLGGATAVNDRLATYPELPNTRLQPLDATRFYVGNSTAKESLWVMTQLMSQKDNYQQFLKDPWLPTSLPITVCARSWPATTTLCWSTKWAFWMIQMAIIATTWALCTTPKTTNRTAIRS